jgi:hypothetical protein
MTGSVRPGHARPVPAQPNTRPPEHPGGLEVLQTRPASALRWPPIAGGNERGCREHERPETD